MQFDSIAGAAGRRRAMHDQPRDAWSRGLTTGAGPAQD